MSIYTDEGYKSRRDYLESLADEVGVPKATVFMLAAMLGPDEDFDGLVTSVEDVASQLELDERGTGAEEGARTTHCRLCGQTIALAHGPGDRSGLTLYGYCPKCETTTEAALGPTDLSPRLWGPYVFPANDGFYAVVRDEQQNVVYQTGLHHTQRQAERDAEVWAYDQEQNLSRKPTGASEARFSLRDRGRQSWLTHRTRRRP